MKKLYAGILLLNFFSLVQCVRYKVRGQAFNLDNVIEQYKVIERRASPRMAHKNSAYDMFSHIEVLCSLRRYYPALFIKHGEVIHFPEPSVLRDALMREKESVLRQEKVPALRILKRHFE